MSGQPGLASCWGAPAALAALAVVMLRLGRTEPLVALVVAGLALIGTGLPRFLAGARGGAAGRAAELLLAATGLAWLLAEPASQRTLVALAGTLTAGALATFAVWSRADGAVKRQLAAVAGAAAGLVLSLGYQGGGEAFTLPVLAMAALAASGHLLARVVPPPLAIAATLALAAAIGPAAAPLWLLPPLVAASLVALAERRTWVAAGLAVGAAAIGPGGVAVALGLLAASCRRSRSAWPLLALLPAAALAWWRLPDGGVLLHAPAWSSLAAALPLAPAALPLLLPAVVIGLGSRQRPDGEGRDALGVGLAALPFLAPSAAVAAALWLAVLPAAGGDHRLERWLRATLPWTVAASLTLLLLSPWGGASLLPWRQPWLTMGWTVALLVSAVPVPVARLSFLLPAAGLLWTLPVEGIDRQLQSGEVLHLREDTGWVLMVGSRPGEEGGRLEGGDGSLPAGGGQRLVEPAGTGAAVLPWQRWLTTRSAEATGAVRAEGTVVVRAEELAAWRARWTRLLTLLGGAIALLLAAHLLPRAAGQALDAGTALVLGWSVAAGSAVAPLARSAAVGAADLALAVLAAALLAMMPALGRRRFLAGALLLVPLAVVQPLLRPPAGDEVYHLQLLESLRADQDLAVANNLDLAAPEEAAYARHGDSLIHSPAIALVTLPGFLLFGHAGALAVAALAVAAGLALAARRAEALGIGRRAVHAAWLLSLATYPVLTFATQLWPAGFAILLVALALELAARRSALGTVAAAAASLLLKLRLGLFTLPILAVTLPRRRLLLPLAAVGFVGVVLASLGSPLGRVGIGELLPASAGRVARAAWGLLWDGAGGLAFACPLWLLAALALPALWRRGGPGERALAVGGALTFCTLSLRRVGEWYGGGAPPARYLVPLVPLVLIALAALLSGVRGRRLVRLALPWSALAAWVAVTRPLWLFNPVDGGWWLPDRLAPALGAAARDVLPSLLRPNLAALLVPAVLAAFAFWWSRRQRAGAAGVLLAGLLLLVGVACGRREATVHLEDPQVEHLAGSAHPPSGTMNRAVSGVSWRLPPGGEVDVPWRAPLGVKLAVRVRLAAGGGGRLLASWDDSEAAVTPVKGGHWQSMALPNPLTLGRGRLHLRWEELPGKPAGDLLLDRVEVAR